MIVTPGKLQTAAYSPDGKSVASAGTDRTIRVWEASNRRDVAVLHGHTGFVSDLAFAADGLRLASTSQFGRFQYAGDDTVRIWDVSHQAGTSVLLGHSSYVYPVALSPDGRWIASGGWDNTVRLWDAVTGESCAILPHPGSVRAWPLARTARGWFPAAIEMNRCGSGTSRPPSSRKSSRGLEAL